MTKRIDQPIAQHARRASCKQRGRCRSAALAPRSCSPRAPLRDRPGRK